MVTWQTKNEASGKWSDCRSNNKVYSDEKKASPVTAQETAPQQPRPAPQVLAQPQYVQPQYVEPAKPQPQEEQYVDLVDDNSMDAMNTTCVDVVDETGSVVAQKPAPVPANMHLTGGGYGGPKHDSWYQQQEYQRQQQAYDQQVNYSPNYTPATAIGPVAPPVQDVCQDVCELTQSFAQLKCTQAYVDMTCPQPTYDEQWGCKKGFSGNAPIWRPTCA